MVSTANLVSPSYSQRILAHPLSQLSSHFYPRNRQCPWEWHSQYPDWYLLTSTPIAVTSMPPTQRDDLLTLSLSGTGPPVKTSLSYSRNTNSGHYFPCFHSSLTCKGRFFNSLALLTPGPPTTRASHIQVSGSLMGTSVPVQRWLLNPTSFHTIQLPADLYGRISPFFTGFILSFICVMPWIVSS